MGYLAAIVFLGIGTTTTRAAAKSNPLGTVGIGATLGMARHRTHTHPDGRAFSSEINIRIRALYVLGLEIAYSPTDRLVVQEVELYDSRLKVSALLHLLPTTPTGLYLKAGVGGSGFSRLRFGAAAQSYHAGAGLLTYLGDHLALTGEIMMVLPGSNAWQSNVASLSQQSKRSAASSLSQNQSTSRGITDLSPFVGGSSRRLAVGVRYYW